MRISDWSSDVCSSDLSAKLPSLARLLDKLMLPPPEPRPPYAESAPLMTSTLSRLKISRVWPPGSRRSEEHTSELQSLMRISYAVFCLKTKNKQNNTTHTRNIINHKSTTHKEST